MGFLRDVLHLIGPYKRNLGYICVMLLFFEVLRVAENRFLGLLIDDLVGISIVNTGYLMLWVGMSLSRWVFDAFADYHIVKLVISVDYRIPDISIQHLMRLSMNFFSNAGTGRMAKRIEKATNSMSELIQAFSWEFLSSTIQYVTTGVYLFYMHPYWGGVLLGVAPAFIVTTALLNRIKQPMRKRRHDLYEESGHLLYQILLNIPVIKAFAQEVYESEMFQKVLSKIYNVSLREFKYDAVFNLVRNSLITVTLVSIFYIGANGVIEGTVKVGDVVVAINLATAASISMFRLTRIYVRIMDNYEAISRVARFLEEIPDVVDAPDAIVLSEMDGLVEFRDVSFSYSNGTTVFDDEKPKEEEEPRDCLKGISFTIQPGQTVGIVGPSGSGKSTLMNLLMRFMDPTKGQVLIDGHDLKTLQQQSFRRFMAVVLQDNVLFDRTLGENVAEGLDVLDYMDVEPKIWQALTESYAHQFVSELPNSLQTVVGERGIKLSGGQRQRVAIARALVKEPKILIMDEATSSVDTESEMMIQQALADRQQQRNATVFIIAHRLSTIRNADVILVLKDGELVQVGSHEELMKEEGSVYAKMVGIQKL